MAEANVGIRVTLLDGATSGLNILNGALSNVGLRVAGLHGGIGGMDPKLLSLGVTAGISGAAFLGLAGILRQSIDAASQFQSELLKVQLSVDGAKDHAQALSALMLKLGSNSVYSSAQIADAFVAIGVKGLSATDILNGLGEQSIYLAQAMGQSDAAGAASLLAQSIQVFGGNAQDATQYANDLLFSFRHGINDVGDLSTAIQQAGAQAALMKIPFGEFTAALSFLGEAGLTGSKAGTSLRYMLASLADPTSKAYMELSDLGVIVVNKTAPALLQLEDAARRSGKSGAELVANFDGTTGSLSRMFSQAQKINGLHTDETFFQWATKTGLLSDKLYDAQGNFIGIAGALQQIGGAIQNAPDQTKVAALQQLFNVRGGQGADEFLKDLPVALQALQQFQSQEAKTSAAGDAAKQHDTLKVSIQGLKTSWTDWLAAVGGADLKPLTGGAHSLTNALVSMIQPQQDGTYALKGHASAMIQAGAALSGLTFLGSGAGAMWMMLNKHMDIFTGQVDSAGQKIFKTTSPLGQLKDGFSGLLSPFGKLTGLLPALGGQMKSTFTVDKIAHFFDVMQDHSPGNMIAGLFTKIRDGGGILQVLNDGIGGLVKGGLGMLTGGITGAAGAIGSFVIAALPVIAVLVAIAGAAAIVVLLFTTFRKQGDEIVGVLKQAFGPAIQGIVKQFQSIVKDVGKQWHDIQPQLKTAMDGLVSAFHKAEPTIKFFANLIGGVIQIVLGVLGGLVKGFVSVLPSIVGVFSGVMNLLGGIGDFVKALFDGPNGWKKIPHIVKGIFGDLFSVIGNAKDTIIGLAGNIVGGLFDGLKRGMDQIGGFPKQVFDAIVGGIKNLFGIKSPATQMLDIGGNILEGLKNGILNAIPNLVSALGGIKDAIMNKVKSMFGIASPSKVMHEMGTFLSLGLSEGIQAVDVAGKAARHFSQITPAIQGVVSAQVRTPAIAQAMAVQGTQGGNVYHNHFEINGREVGRVVMDQFGNVLQMNGLARKLN